MGTPRPAAIIEVSPDVEGRLPVELVRSAYFASRSGPVVLVLRGVAPEVIDRLLNPVVESGGEVHGVLYSRPDEVATLVARFGAPRLAVVSPGPLHALLEAQQARMVAPGEAVAWLSALSPEAARPA